MATEMTAPAQSRGLPSPTFTNPDLILPSGRASTPPPLVPQQPPSPSALRRRLSPSPDVAGESTAAHAEQRASPRSESPGSELPTALPIVDEDSHATPRREREPSAALASSPTIQDHAVAGRWKPQLNRRESDKSSSPNSNEPEKMNWLDLGGRAKFGAVNEDSDEDVDGLGPLPGLPKKPDEEARNASPKDRADESEDDFEHMDLSKRAEMILANAKKRLNLMEGNLRGARNSLLVSPTSSYKASFELPTQVRASRDRDRRLYAGKGFIPPRERFPVSTGSSSRGSGHNRGMSENYVASTNASGPVYKTSAVERRASSAMGSFGSPSAAENSFKRVSVRPARSQEAMRNERLASWQKNSAGTPSEEPPVKLSPELAHSLDTLPEEAATPSSNLQRSASTTTNLRSQMSELRGRISSLQQKAKEDSLRRRSLQSLRTPSPFTAAEIWYSGADSYAGGPITADAGVGSKPDDPVADDSQIQKHSQEEATTPDSTPVQRRSREEIVEEVEEAEEAEDDNGEDQAEPFGKDDMDESYPREESRDRTRTPESPRDNESVYEDVSPVMERHEDRADAFDYENFFLHSAMGTYSTVSRSSSSLGSNDSVETTRPVSPSKAAEDEPDLKEHRPSFHLRNDSVGSVSTVATFQTAVEGQGSEADSEGNSANERLDEFSEQILRSAQGPTLNSTLKAPQVPAGRADSAVSVPHSHSNSITQGSPAEQIVAAILLRSKKTGRRRPSLEKPDKELIEGLADGFVNVCNNLLDTSIDDYERRVWRRRLDDARRMLNGEGEGEAF